MKKQILSMILIISVLVSALSFPTLSATAAQATVTPIGIRYPFYTSVMGVESTSSLNVRSGPGTNYSIIDKLPYDAEFISLLLNKNTLCTNYGSPWIFIEYTRNGTYCNGWVHSDYVNFNNIGAMQCGKVVGVNSDSHLNVRSTPSTNGTIVGKLKYDAKFIIMGQQGSFYMIAYDLTKWGYVSTSYAKIYDQVGFL